MMSHTDKSTVVNVLELIAYVGLALIPVAISQTLYSVLDLG